MRDRIRLHVHVGATVKSAALAESRMKMDWTMDHGPWLTWMPQSLLAGAAFIVKSEDSCHTTLNPRQHRLRRLIRLASHMMLGAIPPPCEIPLSGFAHLQHFCRTFTQVVARSPAAWRRNAQCIPPPRID